MDFMEVRLSSGKAKIKEGTILYCPSHGPGKVVSVGEREILGEKLVFCTIEFDKDDMNLSIPVSKMKEMGIRSIISKDGAKKIIDTVLNKPAKSTKGIWSKRMQEYEMKLYSGSTIFIAEVVRDLFSSIKDPNKSYGERLIFDKAFDRLSQEMSLALNCSIEEMNKTIMDVLNSNCKTSHVSIAEDNEEEDQGDFDDSEFDEEDNDDSDEFDDKSNNKKDKNVA